MLLRFSLNWLNELTAKPLPALDKTVEALETIGLEISAINQTKPTFTDISVAEVLEVTKHPDADKLVLAKVNSGNSTFNVVCGAPNLKAKQKVAFARVGSALDVPGKGKLEIRKAKIRGQESEGMICSSFELGIGEDKSGILVLPQSWPSGKDLNDYLESDSIIELELPPHRWDLTGHLGLARELSVYLWRSKAKARSNSNIKPNKQASGVTIDKNAVQSCSRYLGGLFTNINIAPSPPQISWRLLNMGISSINNVVDITNYVCLETGNPMHAFDFNELNGRKIIVRFAGDRESVNALDGKKYDLRKGVDLVIADANRPVALAGIIGGSETSVTQKTRDIYLECAAFKRETVRQSSTFHQIKTDSSIRFEKGIDRDSLPIAFKRAKALLEDHAAAKQTEFEDRYPSKKKPVEIRFKTQDLKNILGCDISDKDVSSVLKPLSLKLDQKQKGSWRFTPETYRQDLELTEDLAEELLRHLGFDKIKSTKAHNVEAANSPKLSEQAKQQELLVKTIKTFSNSFSSFGFYEAMNLTLISKAELESVFGARASAQAIPIANPISNELDIVRTTLFPGLMKNWKRNVNRGKMFMRMFEYGQCHGLDEEKNHKSASMFCALAYGPGHPYPYWKLGGKETAFTKLDLIGIIDAIFDSLDISATKCPLENSAEIFTVSDSTSFRAGDRSIGFVSDISIAQQEHKARFPLLYAELDMDAITEILARKPANTFRELPKLQKITKDLAVIVSKDTKWDEISQCTSKALGKNIILVRPFDIYESPTIGEDKKSVAFTIEINPDIENSGKSLVQEEIQVLLNKVIKALETDLNAKLRE
ncbi:phenylalanine--tRNA ligase subunit beta [Elusimicrobiota bacterium]